MKETHKSEGAKKPYPRRKLCRLNPERDLFLRLRDCATWTPMVERRQLLIEKGHYWSTPWEDRQS